MKYRLLISLLLFSGNFDSAGQTVRDQNCSTAQYTVGLAPAKAYQFVVALQYADGTTEYAQIESDHARLTDEQVHAALQANFRFEDELLLEQEERPIPHKDVKFIPTIVLQPAGARDHDGKRADQYLQRICTRAVEVQLQQPEQRQ